MKRLLIAIFLIFALSGAQAQATTRTYTFRAGPFVMGGFNTSLPKLHIRAPHVNGYITAMRTYLVYTNNRQVSIKRVMLHHTVFINSGRSSREFRGSCAGRFGEPFYGTGEEHQRLILPPGYGYHLDKDDKWRLQAMLMSHSQQFQRVYVAYRVRVVSGAAARRLHRVRPYWIRANGCATEQPSYTVDGGGPPGAISRLSYTWRVPMTGRLVAAGGHLHAGSIGLSLSEPTCGNRELFDTTPSYAPQNALVYRLRPILHEPGPISTKYFLSKKGIPVRRGQILRLTGAYDGEHPRARVMSIMHIYIAGTGDDSVRDPCGALPNDMQSFWLHKGVTTKPPYEPIPLNMLHNGHVVAVPDLPGATKYFTGNASVALRSTRFSPRRVSIPQGAALTWHFDDPFGHNILFASGPRVVGTGTFEDGAQQTHRFMYPGTYKLFCYLHPVTMQQEVVVRPR